MRWVLPLVVSVVLAAGTGDRSLLERKRARPALGRTSADPADGSLDGRPVASQRASFDPATGTLTWFDDDERYN